MDNIALKDMAWELGDKISDGSISEDEIIQFLEKTPELSKVMLRSGANLFIQAVLYNKLKATEKLIELGSDKHLKVKASLISGNALNVAKTPEMAVFLLGHGLEIEKNLCISEDYWNPAVKAASHNDSDIVLYWLRKKKELFEDTMYLKDLIYAMVRMAIMINQVGLLACIMKSMNCMMF